MTLSAASNPTPKEIEQTHQGRRAGRTSPHLRRPPKQENSSAPARPPGRQAKSGAKGASGGEHTGGQGLDHASAAAAEVAKDLLRAAGGVVRASAGVHLGFRRGGGGGGDEGRRGVKAMSGRRRGRWRGEVLFGQRLWAFL